MPKLDIVGSDSKRVLLQLMKRRGEVSIDEAKEATGLARTTLREHLAGLERDGLIRHFSTPEGPGRPSLRYRLAERADELFPLRDGVLLRELIGFLGRKGRDDLVKEFFHAFWEARFRDAQFRLETVDAWDEAGRLEVLSRLLEEQGFMPEIRTSDDETVIRECNCPFPEAVKQTRLPCRLEAEFFERIMQRKPRRVSYIPEGHAACSYAFPPEAEATPPRPA